MRLPLTLAILLLASMVAALMAADPDEKTIAVPDEKTIAVNDRVGFPANYQVKFQSIRASNKTSQTLLGTIYANEKAASIREVADLPYPNGSMIVMEWAQPLKDETGALLLDGDGLWRKGDIVRVDVMRREAGYGESYGERRSGEWEYASYRPDGSFLQPIEKSASCAECHQTASAGRDFVFRGRFPPLLNE